VGMFVSNTRTTQAKKVTLACARARGRQVRHSQLTSFFMSMTMKEEMESNTKNRHLMEEFLDSLVGMALDSRAQELRSQLGDPPFYSLDWSYLNSPREGCVLNSLTVHGEARKWKSAVSSAVDLVSSLVRYGLVQTELDRLVLTLMRQFELDAEQYETQESADVMARLQETAEAREAYMTPLQRLHLFRQLLPAVTLEAVNVRAQQLYGFACHGSRSSALLHLFVCGPTDSSSGENFDSLRASQLPSLLAKASEGAATYVDKIVVPDFLCQEQDITALVAQRCPAWVPLPDEICAQPALEMSEGGTRAVSKDLNVTIRRLGNGVRVIYKRTPFEKNQMTIEMHLLGGRACEGVVPGYVLYSCLGACACAYAYLCAYYMHMHVCFCLYVCVVCFGAWVRAWRAHGRET